MTPETCLFCGGTAATLRKVTLCRFCGESLSREKLEEELGKYGLRIEDVIDGLREHKDKLIDLLSRRGVTYSYLAGVIAYSHYRMRDYRKAREILHEHLTPEARQKFRRVVDSIFGRNLCLNDCVINMFIEKCEELDIPPDKVDEGVSILRRVGERTSLTRTVAAAVLHLVTGMSQESVAKAFGITSASIRLNIKKYGLGRELFIERAVRYGLDVEKGLEILNGENAGLVEAATVFYVLSGVSAGKVAEIFNVSKVSVLRKGKEMKGEGEGEEVGGEVSVRV